MWFSGSAASRVSQGTFPPAQEISDVSPPAFLKKMSPFYPKDAC